MVYLHLIKYLMNIVFIETVTIKSSNLRFSNNSEVVKLDNKIT